MAVKKIHSDFDVVLIFTVPFLASFILILAMSIWGLIDLISKNEILSGAGFALIFFSFLLVLPLTLFSFIYLTYLFCPRTIILKEDRIIIKNWIKRKICLDLNTKDIKIEKRYYVCFIKKYSRHYIAKCVYFNFGKYIDIGPKCICIPYNCIFYAKTKKSIEIYELLMSWLKKYEIQHPGSVSDELVSDLIHKMAKKKTYGEVDNFIEIEDDEGRKKRLKEKSDVDRDIK